MNEIVPITRGKRWGEYRPPVSRIESDIERRDRWRDKAADWYASLWFWEKWWLWFGGSIPIGKERFNPGFDPVELHLFWCQPCRKPDIDYEHEKEYRFRCSICTIPH